MPYLEPLQRANECPFISNFLEQNPNKFEILFEEYRKRSITQRDHNSVLGRSFVDDIRTTLEKKASGLKTSLGEVAKVAALKYDREFPGLAFVTMDFMKREQHPLLGDFGVYSFAEMSPISLGGEGSLGKFLILILKELFGSLGPSKGEQVNHEFLNGIYDQRTILPQDLARIQDESVRRTHLLAIATFQPEGLGDFLRAYRGHLSDPSLFGEAISQLLVSVAFLGNYSSISEMIRKHPDIGSQAIDLLGYVQITESVSPTVEGFLIVDFFTKTHNLDLLIQILQEEAKKWSRSDLNCIGLLNPN